MSGLNLPTVDEMLALADQLEPRRDYLRRVRARLTSRGFGENHLFLRDVAAAVDAVDRVIAVARSAAGNGMMRFDLTREVDVSSRPDVYHVILSPHWRNGQPMRGDGEGI